MKKVITLEDVRAALTDTLDAEGKRELDKMSDEALLDSNLNEDLLMDSLEIIESVMVLEKECGISVPDESYDNFRKNGSTVRAMIDEINRVINL